MDSEALLMTIIFSVVSTLIRHRTLIVPLFKTLQHANLLKICPVEDFKDLDGINPFY